MFVCLSVPESSADEFLLAFLQGNEPLVDSALEYVAIDVRFGFLTDAEDTAERFAFVSSISQVC